MERLAGTGLYSVYGREITGRTLDEIYNSTSAEYWRVELNKVGVSPNVQVPVTKTDDVVAEREQQLAKALEIIQRS